MMHHVLSWLIMMLTMASCVGDDEPEEWSLGPGDRVPEFTVTLNDGSTLSTAGMKGRRWVIVFFNTSCPDCRRELPQLQSAYEARPEGEEWVCISREEGAAAIARFWEAHGLTMPYSAQEDRRVYSLFASTGIPRVYHINAEGIIEKVEGAE